MRLGEVERLGRSVRYNFYDIFQAVQARPQGGLSIQLRRDRPAETRQSGIYVWHHPDWGYFYVGIAAADNFTERWNKHIQKLLDQCTSAKQMANWRAFAQKFAQQGYGINDLRDVTLRFYPRPNPGSPTFKKELEDLETRIVGLINPMCNREYNPNRPSSTKIPPARQVDEVDVNYGIGKKPGDLFTIGSVYGKKNLSVPHAKLHGKKNPRLGIPEQQLDESSGYSLVGSFTRDLTTSKVWLLTELARIAPTVGTVYILGSWYGNMSLYMNLLPLIRYNNIINVETNQDMLDQSQRMLDHVGASNIEFMLKDANDLDYRQLGNAGVVINTSLTDMDGTDWFRHIPDGTMVAMQARDRDPGHQFDSPKDILKKFPLDQVLYTGTKELEDPETRYRRFMVIGRK